MLRGLYNFLEEILFFEEINNRKDIGKDDNLEKWGFGGGLLKDRVITMNFIS